MASFCLRPISEPSRSLYEFRTPTYCFEMAMEELVVNFKTWSIWTGTSCIRKEQRLASFMPLHTWSQARDTHARLAWGFYNAGLSGLAEAGSLNHQTKHLSFTVQLWYSCSDPCEERTFSCVCTSACVVSGDLRVPGSSILITDLASVDCQWELGFTASFPRGEFSLKSWYTQNSISIV